MSTGFCCISINSVWLYCCMFLSYVESVVPSWGTFIRFFKSGPEQFTVQDILAYVVKQWLLRIYQMPCTIRDLSTLLLESHTLLTPMWVPRIANPTAFWVFFPQLWVVFLLHIHRLVLSQKLKRPHYRYLKSVIASSFLSGTLPGNSNHLDFSNSHACLLNSVTPPGSV